MTGDKQPRDLKPGDLYVVTGGGACGGIADLEMGAVTNLFGGPGTHRLKLVERHPCGALEFLILPPPEAIR